MVLKKQFYEIFHPYFFLLEHFICEPNEQAKTFLQSLLFWRVPHSQRLRRHSILALGKPQLTIFKIIVTVLDV